MTVADGRIPALTPFWESVSLPGVFFAGNASQGARGIGKRGAGASSTSVNGFRYNARVLARHLAERLDGREPQREPVAELVPFLLRELTSAPELWVQKGYLCRVVSAADGSHRGRGASSRSRRSSTPPVPTPSPRASRWTRPGKIVPTLYVRRGGEIREHQLDPHPLHRYDGEQLPQARRRGGLVKREELREAQRPLKERYREDAASAQLTLRADGELGAEQVSCSVETGRALVEAGLHPASGGDGTLACSGDMLLQALVACAGVTLRSVAVNRGLEVRGRVRGRRRPRLPRHDGRRPRGAGRLHRDPPALRARVRRERRGAGRAARDTERYCVVYQTLAGGVPLTISRSARR